MRKAKYFVIHRLTRFFCLKLPSKIASNCQTNLPQIAKQNCLKLPNIIFNLFVYNILCNFVELKKYRYERV